MPEKPPFIVCEIGMNHLGDQEYADTYLDALVAAKPDGATFQVREASYVKQQPGGPLYLSDNYYRSAAERLSAAGVQFGVALCDKERLPFFESIGAAFYKVLSKDIGNHELVAALVGTGKPVYVSTGMSDEDDIESFLGAIGRAPNLALLHTQLSYDDEDTNLRAIARLRERFGVDVAYGSHSRDVNALYASLGFGPSAIFLYVKGEREVAHGDEDHAIRLSDGALVASNLRRLHAMMGDGVKKKMENRIASAKSPVKV